MGSPPYSPDLVPNDFFQTPNIKNKMRGTRFLSPEKQLIRDTFKNQVSEVYQAGGEQ